MFTNELKNWLIDNCGVRPAASDDDFSTALVKAIGDGSISEDKVRELMQLDDTPTARDIFGGKAGKVDAKAPSARYKAHTYTAKHARTGKPVRDQKGNEVQTLSERDHARIGAYHKWLALRGGLSNFQLNEHEKQMVAEMFDSKEVWVGEFNGEYRDNWSGNQLKAPLLSDTNSGGVFVNPIWYDDAIITYPLLHGQLFPFVDIVDVPRSNVVNSASIGNPTVTWGQTDGTAISVFDSTSLIGQLDTSIFDCMLALEIGRTELADSIVPLGQYLMQVVGQRYLSELDKVIASGDGTTQPQGIVNFSGLTTIPTISGPGAPPTLSDLENLYFGIGLQYRSQSEMGCAFVSNDVTYSRCRAIPVGTDDARRVLGQNEGSYDALSSPWRISQSLANQMLIFGALKKYRFYRRAGQQMRYETAGQTLALKNTVLLVSIMRCGGRVMDGNAFIAATTMQP